MQAFHVPEATESLTKSDTDPPHSRLVFHLDGMYNTTVTRDNFLLYVIRSSEGRDWTEISDANGTQIARVDYRLFSADTITMHGVTKKTKEWLSNRKTL
jgi:hypothetical protein